MEALMLLYALTFLAGAMLFQSLRANRRGELTQKLGVATLLGAAAAFPEAFGVPAGWQGPVLWVALVTLSWFALVPIVARSIARTRPALGRRLEEAAIWSTEGRAEQAVNRAAIALGSEDAKGALVALSGVSHPEAPTWRAVAWALEEQWEQVLAIPAEAAAGPQGLHLRGARILALAESGWVDEARREVQAIRDLQIPGMAPVVKESMALLGELDIAAAQGDVQAALAVLDHPLPQMRAGWVLWRLGLTMDRAGRREDAKRTWLQAWDRVQSHQKVVVGKLREGLRSHGVEPPAVRRLQAATPVATAAVTGLIGVAFLIQVLIERSIHPMAPFELGAFFVPPEGEPWRLVSYGLVHAGLVHAGMNAWVMWDVGRLLERRAGPAPVVASFVLGVLGGSLLSQAFMDEGALVGASGGVLGVGGALLVDAWQRSAQEGTQLFRGVGTWLAIIMVFSVVFPNVSIWGHLGGIIAGAAFGLGFGRLRGRSVDWALIGASALVIVWGIAGIVAKGAELRLW